MRAVLRTVAAPALRATSHGSTCAHRSLHGAIVQQLARFLRDALRKPGLRLWLSLPQLSRRPLLLVQVPPPGPPAAPRERRVLDVRPRTSSDVGHCSEGCCPSVAVRRDS